MRNSTMYSLYAFGSMFLIATVCQAGPPRGGLRKSPGTARPTMPRLALPPQAAPTGVERAATGLRRAQDGINRAATGMSRAASGLERATPHLHQRLPHQPTVRPPHQPQNLRTGVDSLGRSLQPLRTNEAARPLPDAATGRHTKQGSVIPASAAEQPSQVVSASGQEPRGQSATRLPAQLPDEATKSTSWMDRFHLTWPFSAADR